ncbi:hypothetical protein H4R18_004174 [Coemansia javaensis]|uniref:Uncharacterized protein n=1 Tax=Coemansia javaensis TaxID=2761396 RepID=A0A9W8H9S1_9FUNG|nr:hypothetical protein H4R18_004174 [Coemansia javaensis]
MHIWTIAVALALALASSAWGGGAPGVAIDVTVSAPMFLVQVPFAVASGPDSVTESIRIYYTATRSVKAVGAPGQRFRADYSVVTFLFLAEYTASIGGGALVTTARDTVYVSRIEATLQSLEVGFVI